jgi:hypothetical protein
VTAIDVFKETIFVCKLHLRDTAVAANLALAEEAMRHHAEKQAVRACLLAAVATGEAATRQRRAAMEGSVE